MKVLRSIIDLICYAERIERVNCSIQARSFFFLALASENGHRGQQVSLQIWPRAEREIRKNDRGKGYRMNKPTFKHMISSDDRLDELSYSG